MLISTDFATSTIFLKLFLNKYKYGLNFVHHDFDEVSMNGQLSFCIRSFEALYEFATLFEQVRKSEFPIMRQLGARYFGPKRE